MSDEEFNIKHPSSDDEVNVEHSSIEYDAEEYADRVRLLNKITNEDKGAFEYEHTIPDDLLELNQKLNNKPKEKPQKQVKRSWVPVNTLRVAQLIHLLKLYQMAQQFNQLEIAKCLSYFHHSVLETIEQQLKNAITLQDKLNILFLNYTLTFTLRSFVKSDKFVVVEPELFTLRFAQLCTYYGIETRIVRAFDLTFCGLEQKFRIKSIIKEKIIEESTVAINQGLKTQQIFEKNSQFFVPQEEVESLDQYMFNSKSQTNTTKPIQYKPPIKSKGKVKGKQINDEITERNQCIWLELFDSESMKWVPFDPISDHAVSLDISIIQRKLHHSFTYYIMSTQQIEFKDDNLCYVFKERIFEDIYFVELTQKYCHQYMAQRATIQLSRWFSMFAYQQKLYYKGIPQLLVKSELFEADMMAPNIQSYQAKDFKYCKTYTIVSQLSQYQMIHPDAKPTNLNFKDEPIYFRKDLVILHSRDKWRVYLRNVPEGAVPIKEVTSKFDKTKITQLFAIWQTEQLKVSLEQNGGQLPQNQYGNYETFAYPPPKGTRVYYKVGFKNILVKNQIPFVEAVSGFDSKSSKLFASKCGYLIFEEDYDRVHELYQDYQIKVQIRNRENKKKELKKLWSDLFKTILMKRDLQIKYQQQPQ